jgi:hypothetical protein
MLPWQAKLLGACCLLLGCLAAGCGSPATPPPPSPTALKLQAIGKAYVDATVRQNRPPANLDELLPSLQEQGDPHEFLVSPSDGNQFEIVWSVELRRLKAYGSEVPVIAFERQGKDGKRYVLRGRADVVQLSDSALKSSRLPEGYKFPF